MVGTAARLTTGVDRFPGSPPPAKTLFGRTVNAMHAAGATIEEIVTTYADSDMAARDSLNSAWANGQRPGLDDYEEQYRTDAPAVVLKP